MDSFHFIVGTDSLVSFCFLNRLNLAIALIRATRDIWTRIVFRWLRQLFWPQSYTEPHTIFDVLFASPIWWLENGLFSLRSGYRYFGVCLYRPNIIIAWWCDTRDIWERIVFNWQTWCLFWRNFYTLQPSILKHLLKYLHILTSGNGSFPYNRGYRFYLASASIQSNHILPKFFPTLTHGERIVFNWRGKKFHLFWRDLL